jgi:hypothetical protein
VLDRVVTELGPGAAIAEVNKIRSGGVAGFFCREEFEVIVDTGAKGSRPTGTRAQAGDSSGNRGRTSLADATREDINDARFRAALLHRLNETAETEAAMAARRQSPARAPGRGPKTIELTDDPIDLGTTPQPPPLLRPDPAPWLVEPEPDPDPDPAWLVEPEPEPDPEPAWLIEPEPATLIEPEPEPDPEPATLIEPEPEPISEDPDPGVEMQAPGPDLGFWSRLASARSGLHAFVPERVGLAVVVGPLTCTMPVVRRLQCQDHIDPEDVVVLTARADIVSEPAWNLVRQNRQLIEAAEQGEGRSRLLVVDVPADHPKWVSPLVGRLRTAGIDIVRYVVPDSPAPDDLLRYWAGPESPYVIDLVSRLGPEAVVKLIRHGHPIATVAGVDLSAALLLAMGGADNEQ